MDISSVTSTAAQGVQGQHRHHHRPSLADMVSKMESGIDNAVKAGKLTGDQADQLTKALDSIADALKKAQAGGNQLSADDRKQIGHELRDIAKQLFAALNPQAASGGSGDDLFKKIDANGDGRIDKNELTSFVNQATGNGRNPADLFGSGATYSQSAMMSVSVRVTQASFTVMA